MKVRKSRTWTKGAEEEDRREEEEDRRGKRKEEVGAVSHLGWSAGTTAQGNESRQSWVLVLFLR